MAALKMEDPRACSFAVWSVFSYMHVSYGFRGSQVSGPAQWTLKKCLFAKTRDWSVLEKWSNITCLPKKTSGPVRKLCFGNLYLFLFPRIYTGKKFGQDYCQGCRENVTQYTMALELFIYFFLLSYASS